MASAKRMLLDKPALHLCPAIPDDLPQITRIAAASLPEAWPMPVLAACLEIEQHHLVVAFRKRHHLHGYYLASRVEDDSELLQLVVEQDCRRQRIASRLMEHLLTHSAHHSRITLEVRASNHAAIQLYQQHGFSHIATRRGYYRPAPPHAQREDAVVMQRQS